MSSTAQDYARLACAEWVSLDVSDPIVDKMARVMEQLAEPMKQCFTTGYGSIEVKFKDKRLAGLDWRQGYLFQ